MLHLSTLVFLVVVTACATVTALVPTYWGRSVAPSRPVSVWRMAERDNEDEATRLQQQAAKLREQIRQMEANLGDQRPRNYERPPPPQSQPDPTDTNPSLKGKRVLVTGANGRLGSMVCRYLLRNHPQTEVVAAVHVVGENSSTSRGYGRLSYEVGAEDGVGRIGPAWSSEDRTATFEWDISMKDYNLQNLRLVEVELLDPVKCRTVAEGCDAVIWCATDFNGNRPRAISGLNVAFLFRAVASPTKGRVEVEGLENMLGALKTARQDKQRATGRVPTNDPVNVVLVSTAPDAYDDFETPFGSFRGIKRQGEQMLQSDFPSLSHTILQLSRFEDNFVEEGLDVSMEPSRANDVEAPGDADKARRRINRRDAAKVAVDALLDKELKDKTVQVWTATR